MGSSRLFVACLSLATQEEEAQGNSWRASPTHPRVVLRSPSKLMMMEGSSALDDVPAGFPWGPYDTLGPGGVANPGAVDHVKAWALDTKTGGGGFGIVKQRPRHTRSIVQPLAPIAPS